MLSNFLDNEAKIYQCHFPDVGDFGFRLLSLKEYATVSRLRLLGLFQEHQLEEEIFKRCYVGEAYLLSVDLPAGVTISIGKLILWLSGDCDQETICIDIQKSREMNPQNTLYEYMRAVIVSAFPSYNLENIESWSRLEFIRKFVIAENVLSKKDESYTQLDLSKVGAENTITEKSDAIDFDAENRALMRNQNPLDVEEAQRSINKMEAVMLDRRKAGM